MLYWAAVFFIIALIAAVLGFGGIAAGAAGIAKILFFIFLIAFVVSLLMGVFRRSVYPSDPKRKGTRRILALRQCRRGLRLG